MKPSSISRIAAIIGEDSARTMIERLGGMCLYIPICPTSSSPLVLAIGHGKAARIADKFGGQTLRVPPRSVLITQRRREDIEYDIRRGLSSQEIANRHGISGRRVEQIKRDLKHGRSQASP